MNIINNGYESIYVQTRVCTVYDPWADRVVFGSFRTQFSGKGSVTTPVNAFSDVR